MVSIDLPHRVIVQRIPYRFDPDLRPPASVERIGVDAEGRALYGEPGRAASRKYVFLPAESPALAGYVRDDPPPDYGLGDVLAAAFADPLPRPEALALLGLLVTRHIVLADGTRLGGPREALTEAIGRIALEPRGFAHQARRVPDWALAEALRPRAEALRARLLADPWVRELGQAELGFVRAVTPAEVVVARTTAEPIDVGTALVIRAADGQRPPVQVWVRDVDGRSVTVTQVTTGASEGVSHGDPVEFVPVLQRGA